MHILITVTIIPILFALPCFFVKRAAFWIALLLSVFETVMAALIFFYGSSVAAANLKAQTLGCGVFLAASVFALLITVYSMDYMKKNERIGEYYGYILIALGSAAGVFFAADYFTLLLFWGIVGAMLYLLTGISGAGAASAAKKTFIIVGGSDSLMMFGIGIILFMTKNLTVGGIPIQLSGYLPAFAFLALMSGALAKAGAMPFHSWVPECADHAPIPVAAFFPASLDKLLGIYLLFRLCTDVFIVTPNSPASILLMAIGSLTIIGAVMAAMVQHNLKKLLSFHAVSQVGYMVLGIGTALPIGMAGALFHMFNNTIYKTCLFLTGGSVEKEANTDDLEHLGGLARMMPVTFASAAIAALSISGIPPFNGFFSKWMIYQGVIELSRTSSLWIFWLVAAMLGSALTLASFVKFMHAVYLGQASKMTAHAKEVHWTMWLPPAILAGFCVLFGIFAYSIPLPLLVLPSVKGLIYAGSWDPFLATCLLAAAFLMGLFIYWLGKEKNTTSRPAYIGGELMDAEEVKVSGAGFYDTIKEYGPLGLMFKYAEEKLFDIYELGKKLVGFLFEILDILHNGLLHTYMAWMFLGFALILFLLIR